jgi:hypothetical protein
VDRGELKGPASRLSRNLKTFEIAPKKMDINGAKTRGYARSDFEPIWARYLPVPSLTPSNTEPWNHAGQSLFFGEGADEAEDSKRASDQGSSKVPCSMAFKREPGANSNGDLTLEEQSEAIRRWNEQVRRG